MSKGDRKNAREHRHRGKSSESLLDEPQILTALSVLPGQVILDAGCGNGYMAKAFAKHTGRKGKVYALDPDHTAIDILKTETAGTNLDAFVGDITRKTKLAAASIDLIYLSTVIHGFSELQVKGFGAEAKRLLKSGGKLAIVEIKKENTPFGPPLDIRFSPEELRQKIDLHPLWSTDIGDYCYMQLFER